MEKNDVTWGNLCHQWKFICLVLQTLHLWGFVEALLSFDKPPFRNTVKFHWRELPFRGCEAPLVGPTHYRGITIMNSIDPNIKDLNLHTHTPIKNPSGCLMKPPSKEPHVVPFFRCLTKTPLQRPSSHLEETSQSKAPIHAKWWSTHYGPLQSL